MKFINSIGPALLGLSSAICFPQITYADSKITYPENYRQWTHVKSLTLSKQHALANPFAGIHHIYANASAMKGLKSGHYKNGATFVFDLFETQHANNASAEGKRKLRGVMVKDKRRFKETGGWGFEGFADNSKTKRLVTDGGASCYGCHTSQEKTDYVFTQIRKDDQ